MPRANTFHMRFNSILVSNHFILIVSLILHHFQSLSNLVKLRFFAQQIFRFVTLDMLGRITAREKNEDRYHPRLISPNKPKEKVQES